MLCLGEISSPSDALHAYHAIKKLFKLYITEARANARHSQLPPLIIDDEEEYLATDHEKVNLGIITLFLLMMVVRLE